MLKFYHSNFLNNFITAYLSAVVSSSEFKSPAIAAETQLSSMTLTLLHKRYQELIQSDHWAVVHIFHQPLTAQTLSSGKHPGCSKLLPLQNDGGLHLWEPLVQQKCCSFSSHLGLDPIVPLRSGGNSSDLMTWFLL